MSMAALGAKPLPETSRLAVGGPLFIESETAGWPKQNPANNKIAINARPICLLYRFKDALARVIEISSLTSNNAVIVEVCGRIPALKNRRLEFKPPVVKNAVVLRTPDRSAHD